MELKIIFIGTPKFGAITLQGLVENIYKPILVITAPDKPAGRKQILSSSEVKLLAQKFNLPLLQPENIKDIKTKIKDIKPDLIILAAYSQILPKEILEIPKYRSLNIHPSLLPKYRGASPIQTAILNNDKETGATIYLMNEKLDQGKIVSSIKYQVSSNITYKELEKELAELGLKLLLDTIPKWINNEIEPKPQDESKVSYTKIIKKEDGKIDWNRSAQEIKCQIRAFDPWPGSFTFWNQKQIKILEADVVKSSENYAIGKTFTTPENKLCVQCKKDCLFIKKLQLEGKKPMAFSDFLRGNQDFIGNILK